MPKLDPIAGALVVAVLATAPTGAGAATPACKTRPNPYMACTDRLSARTPSARSFVPTGSVRLRVDSPVSYGARPAARQFWWTSHRKAQSYFPGFVSRFSVGPHRGHW